MDFKLIAISLLIPIFLAACGNSPEQPTSATLILKQDAVKEPIRPYPPISDFRPILGAAPCPQTNHAIFDITCLFLRETETSPYEKCRVRAQFVKRVTRRGREVKDESNSETTPKLEIECDESWIQNSYGIRFTQLLGTRIQPESIAYPALVVPEGMLNTKALATEARLELGCDTLHGGCMIAVEPAKCEEGSDLK